MKNINSADDFNNKFKVGSPFTYQSIIGVSTPKEVTTTSEAWELGHGDVVVNITGVSGGVCIEHLEVANNGNQ